MTDNEKKTLIENDIKEREKLIRKYIEKGFFTDSEREDAIKKIQKLRITDQNVSFATGVKLLQCHIPFDEAPDGSIASELQMQVDILVTELGEF